VSSLADELWCFVGVKEKTKVVRLKKTDAELGDAYTFIGIEHTFKLELGFHLGWRTSEDASVFMAKLHAATYGRFSSPSTGSGLPPTRTRRFSGAGWTSPTHQKPTAQRPWIPGAGTHRRG
jgi:hypothetical protein